MAKPTNKAPQSPKPFKAPAKAKTELQYLTFSIVLGILSGLREFAKTGDKSKAFASKFLVTGEDGKRVLSSYYPELQSFLASNPQKRGSLYKALVEAFKAGQIKAAPLPFTLPIDGTGRANGTVRHLEDYAVFNDLKLLQTVDNWMTEASKAKSTGINKKQTFLDEFLESDDLEAVFNLAGQQQKERSETAKARKAKAKTKAAPVEEDESEEDESEDTAPVKTKAKSSNKAAPVASKSAPKSKAKAAPVEEDEEDESEEDESEDTDDFDFE